MPRFSLFGRFGRFGGRPRFDLPALAGLAVSACAAALDPAADDAGTGGSGGAFIGGGEGGVLPGETGGSMPGVGGLVSPPVEEGGQPAPPAGGQIVPVPTPDAFLPSADAAVPPPPDGEFPAVALELCRVVNAYRASRGLPEVALSQALMRVATAHVGDLTRHPDVAIEPCNLHSWSNQGPWTPCCYTSDHAQAQCMWDKPREVGGNGYVGDGFEIAAYGGIDPAQALQLWQQSGPHHEVILNAGIWQDTSPWPAMGCGLEGNYAVVWFGSEPDPFPP